MGIGSSHSPALLMEPPAWVARGETDDRNLHALHDFTGKSVKYDELLAAAPEKRGRFGKAAKAAPAKKTATAEAKPAKKTAAKKAPAKKAVAKKIATKKSVAKKAANKIEK